MLHFFEHPKSDYQARTKVNCSADLTIAFAINFQTSGKISTRKYCRQQQKIYIPIDISSSLAIEENLLSHIVHKLNEVSTTSLHIAGNGLSTIGKLYTQPELNDFLFHFLKAIVESPLLNKKIQLIHSGGQTGIDEAGLKASQKLNIKTIILAPKGWRFRNAESCDICDETAFKQRFL